MAVTISPSPADGIQRPLDISFDYFGRDTFTPCPGAFEKFADVGEMGSFFILGKLTRRNNLANYHGLVVLFVRLDLASTTFVDGLVFPQGVLWHDGAVYSASHPAIWRFEDTDGDGRADIKESAVSIVPQGLEKTMSSQELSDLLEFLYQRR